MCGIAGYNCSVETASKFGDDTATEAMEYAILYNMDRGLHATGLMFTYMPELKPEGFTENLYFGKEPLPGDEFLKVHPKVPGKPVSLAIHTRDATVGPPKDNENNHPVIYDDIFVTHNGGIKNESTFRALVPSTERSKLAYVDSIAIPIYLSRVPNPLEDLEAMDWLIGGLENMMGRYTFHAMYGKHPGLSLIVAGPDRPMWYMYHPGDKMHAYSSERKAADALWWGLGYTDHKGIIEGELKEGTAMLIHCGEVVRRWEFNLPPTTGWVTELKDKVTQQRIGFDGSVIATDSSINHWIRGTKPATLQAAVEDDGYNLALIGGLKASEMEIDEDFRKRFWEGHKIDWAFEADTLYVAWPKWAQKGALSISADPIRFFACYMNCEIVIDNKGSILDVYNLNIEQNGYPWTKAITPQSPPAKIAKNSLKTWLNQNLHKTGVVAKRQAEAKRLKAVANPTTPGIGSSLFSQYPRLNSSNYSPLGVNHPTNPLFTFLDDDKCEAHHIHYTMHSMPDRCAEACLSAWEYLETFTSLFDIATAYEHVSLSVKGGNVCVPKNGVMHTWTPKSYRQVDIEFELDSDIFINKEISFLIGEKCKHCHATRYWTNPVNFGFERLPDALTILG